MIDSTSLSALVEENIARIEYPKSPSGLYSPIVYTMASGGKRLRPLLCMAACQAVCADGPRALRQAMAMEMFHNFTLVHDDVMDRSDTRRGRPTVFAKWGEVQAILSGDTMLSMAYALAADCPAAKVKDVLKLFNNTAIAVYEGQQYDMEFEDRDDVTVDEYIAMIRLKTSALIAGAAAMGALTGDASEATIQAFKDYGDCVGLAFQLRDDWLDTYGDPAVFGKKIGGDIVNRKKTWLFITAMDEAPEAMVKALADNPGRDALVKAVTDVYDSLGLSERCDRLIMQYYDKAVEAIGRADIPVDDRQWFIDLAKKLTHRAV